MTGDRDYRLTPLEQTFLQDHLEAYSDLEGTLEAAGVQLRPEDPETRIWVQETEQEINVSLTVPMDQDQDPENGRLYLHDQFTLSKDDYHLTQHKREFSSGSNGYTLLNYSSALVEKTRLYSGKTNGKNPKVFEGLQDSLKKIPKPSLFNPDLHNLFLGFVKKRRQPFEDAILKEIFKPNISAYDTLSQINQNRPLLLKFRDPQSGYIYHKKGSTLIIETTVIIDHPKESGSKGEINGRVYVNDTYKIDIETKEVLDFDRKVHEVGKLNRSFNKAVQKFHQAEKPSKDDKFIQAIGKALAERIIPKLADSEILSEPPELNLPLDPTGTSYHKVFLESLALFKGSFAHAIFFPPTPAGKRDRLALEEVVSILYENNPQAAGLIFTIREAKGISEDSKVLIDSLVALAAENPDSARELLLPLGTEDDLVQDLLSFSQRLSQYRGAQEILPSLQVTFEGIYQNKLRTDQAWANQIFFTNSDQALTQDGIDGFFIQLRETLDYQGGTLHDALRGMEVIGDQEAYIHRQLTQHPILTSLIALSKNPNRTHRADTLLEYAYRKLFMDYNLGEGAVKILEQYGPANQDGSLFLDWLNGNGSVHQELEIIGTHFVQEALSPIAIISMIVAGGVGYFSKVATFTRLNANLRRTKMMAEGLAMLTEAPAFVITNKVLSSTFVSPEGQWDHMPRDLGGAYLAFIALRSAGILNRQVARFGASNPWLKNHPLMLEGLEVASVHTLTPLALVGGNSLGRALGASESLGQGPGVDFVGDLMMYWHFWLGGKIAHSTFLNRFDPMLAAAESGQLRIKPPKEDKVPIPSLPEPPPPALMEEPGEAALEEVPGALGRLYLPNLTKPQATVEPIAEVIIQNPISQRDTIVLLDSSKNQWTIGRATQTGAQADIPLAGAGEHSLKSVSRQHGFIQVSPEGEFSYVDTSTYGATVVNEGQAHINEPVLLKEGGTSWILMGRDVASSEIGIRFRTLETNRPLTELLKDVEAKIDHYVPAPDRAKVLTLEEGTSYYIQTHPDITGIRESSETNPGERIILVPKPEEDISGVVLYSYPHVPGRFFIRATGEGKTPTMSFRDAKNPDQLSDQLYEIVRDGIEVPDGAQLNIGKTTLSLRIKPRSTQEDLGILE